MIGFRILSLEVDNFFGNPLDIEFFDSNQQVDTASFGCSLLIGLNGTGKSQCLSLIVDIFKHLKILKQTGKFKKLASINEYKIRYIFNDEIYEVGQNGNEGTCINTEGEVSLCDLELPGKILVQSFSISDKFTHTDKDKNDFYTYLGTRTASNAVYTSQIERSIVEAIVKGISNEDFRQFLKNILSFLKFDKCVDITFKVSNMKKLERIMNKSSFIELYNKFIKSNRRASNISRNYDETIAFTKIQDILKAYKHNNGYIEYKIDLNFIEDYSGLNVFYEYLDLLRYMQVLDYAKVKFSKTSSVFSFEAASSGEKQVLYTLLTIYTYIKNNSLILIDEPEISLHPNWQMQYIRLLGDSFIGFGNCHFIIASHSHFLVSDLKMDVSSVIAMKRVDGGIETELYPSSTYGWSAEDILYNVFEVPTTRNYYLAEDVEKVVEDIGRGNMDEDVIKKIKEFEKLLPHIKEIDPLSKIIKAILKRSKQNGRK